MRKPRICWARPRWICAAALIAALASSALGIARAELMSCLDTWPEARGGPKAYDHFVHIRNRCPAAARCEVSSDSNPVPARVIVLQHQSAEVLVRRRSPSRSFVPRVSCLTQPRARPEGQEQGAGCGPTNVTLWPASTPRQRLISN
jgi:hypothetical protein